MRKGLTLTMILLITSITISYGQFSFGISPGIGLNGAYFGYRVNNKFVPYIGFQHLNASFKFEESGERYEWPYNQLYEYSETNEFSGNLYIPCIGTKYFIKQQNKLQAYLSANISKPILSGNIKNNGVDDKDFKEYINSISMWGGEFGFGIEYFFDENFSIGGEYGLRYIHLKYEESNESGPLVQPVATEINFKFNTSPTFSKVSLNFYF